MTNIFSKNKYIVNCKTWAIDETILNESFTIFIVIDIKTRAILGFSLLQYDISPEIIVELFTSIIKNFEKPKYIHGDNKPIYWSFPVRTFCRDQNILISKTHDSPRTNQVVESTNNGLKREIVYYILNTSSKRNTFKQWRKSWPLKFKNTSILKKSSSHNFRKLLFESQWFHQNKGILLEAIRAAIISWNSNQSPTTKLNISRLLFSSFESYVLDPAEFQQASNDTPEAAIIINNNDDKIRTVQTQINSILFSDESWEFKKNMINQLQHQSVNISTEIFINSMKILYDLNAKISIKQDDLLKANLDLKEQLNELVQYKQKKEKEAQLKNQRKLKRLNRKKRAIPGLLSLEQHNQIIQYLEKPTFSQCRARIAFTIMAITGIRFKEMQQLPVGKVISLFQKGKCYIDRVKRGRVNHLAYLTPTGRKFLILRKKDFNVLVAPKISHIEASLLPKEALFDYPLFSPLGRPDEEVNHDHLLQELNLILGEYCKKHNIVPKYTTHCFRHNFITSLWKDTGDIVFISQYMNHSPIESTNNYI